MDVKLHGSHRATYDSIFDRPDRRDVALQDVRSMLGAMPEAADTFHSEVSEAEAEATRTKRGQRCVLIHTRSVQPNDLAACRGSE